MDLEKLKREADQLPARDRQQLLDHLALQARDSAHQRHKESRDLDMWCQALYNVLHRDPGALGVGVPSHAVLRKVVAPLFGPVEAFMEATKLMQAKVPERQAAYALLSRLLVTHAKQVAVKVHAPLSVKFVASCSNAIPGLFEEAFPGYIEAGMARVVAVRAVRHRATVEV